MKIKLQQAADVLDVYKRQELSKLVGTRTNQINRKLREIEELPEAEVCRILPGKPDDEELE